MRWAGHLARMQDCRLPKQLFYGELQLGKRPRHKPKKRYKDVVKHNLKVLGINVEDWEKSATNRPTWRRLVYEGCRRFEAKQLEHTILRRALRKQHTSGILETLCTLQPNPLCDVCGRVCLSRAGLLSHMRSHEAKRPSEKHMFTEAGDLTCHLCDRMCKSKAGLLSHIRAHKRAPL